MRRRGLGAALATLMLAACGGQQALPPPGAEDGILFLWRGGADQALRLAAQRVRQVDEQFGRLRLERVRAELPLRDGRLWLGAEQGDYGAAAEQELRLSPPVLLHGWIGGSPLVGRAEGATVSAREHEMRLQRPVLLRGGERLAHDHAIVPEDWNERELRGHGVYVEPAPPLWAAVLGAAEACGIR